MERILTIAIPAAIVIIVIIFLVVLAKSMYRIANVDKVLFLPIFILEKI